MPLLKERRQLNLASLVEKADLIAEHFIVFCCLPTGMFMNRTPKSGNAVSNHSFTTEVRACLLKLDHDNITMGRLLSMNRLLAICGTSWIPVNACRQWRPNLLQNNHMAWLTELVSQALTRFGTRSRCPLEWSVLWFQAWRSRGKKGSNGSTSQRS